MQKNLSQIAEEYGVSNAAVSAWGLSGEKKGRVFVVDISNAQNAKILAAKTARRPSPSPANLAPAPSTAAPVFTTQNSELEELQAEKLQEEIRRLKIENEKSEFRFWVEKDKIEFEKEKMRRESEKVEIDKQKTLVEKRKLEKETQKIELELAKLENEAKAKENEYVHSARVQTLLEETAAQFNLLRDEILHTLNYNSELQGEKVYELRQIFTRKSKEILDRWTNTISAVK